MRHELGMDTAGISEEERRQNLVRSAGVSGSKDRFGRYRGH